MNDFTNHVTLSSTTQTAEEVQVPVDFAKLKKANPHIYAWINIENANVDYPILQHETDDSYYLNYNLDGTKGYPGCIYTEKIN